MSMPPRPLKATDKAINDSWYGWSAQAKIHWIMPIIGTAIFGFGESSEQ